jgi:hypothetical protein
MQENHSALDKTANVVHNLLSAVGVVAPIDRGFNDVTHRRIYGGPKGPCPPPQDDSKLQTGGGKLVKP